MRPQFSPRSSICQSGSRIGIAYQSVVQRAVQGIVRQPLALKIRMHKPCKAFVLAEFVCMQQCCDARQAEATIRALWTLAGKQD